tara:strand:- start:121395 stop:121796 length:402 start_codon:yes stop_codon:yes gene_type:complete
MSEPKTSPRLEQPCFLVICRDGENSAEPRTRFLKGHLDHVEKNWERYVTAGPVRIPGEEPLVGSVFLVMADTLEDAKALMQGDPYITSGMYETIEFLEFTNSIGRFIGGKIWESAEAIVERALGGATKLTKGE